MKVIHLNHYHSMGLAGARRAAEQAIVDLGGQLGGLKGAWKEGPAPYYALESPVAGSLTVYDYAVVLYLQLTGVPELLFSGSIEEKARELLGKYLPDSPSL